MKIERNGLVAARWICVADLVNKIFLGELSENSGAVGYEVYRGPCWLNFFENVEIHAGILLIVGALLMIFDAQLLYTLNQKTGILRRRVRQMPWPRLKICPRPPADVLKNPLDVSC